MLLPLTMAADETYKSFESHYSRWNQLTSEQLIEKGNDFMRLPEKYDSAMVCFSILSNRYYENRLKGEELAFGVRAMVKMAALLIHHYGDFEKAQSYLLIAEDIAEKNNIE